MAAKQYVNPEDRPPKVGDVIEYDSGDGTKQEARVKRLRPDLLSASWVDLDVQSKDGTTTEKLGVPQRRRGTHVPQPGRAHFWMWPRPPRAGK